MHRSNINAYRPEKILAMLEQYELDDVVDILINLDEAKSAEICKQATLRRKLNQKVPQHQSGSDRIGTAGQLLGAAIGGTAGGTVTVATGVGATLLGSHGLAGILGGIFVTTTPVGWILAGAAAGTALAFASVKAAESGGANNERRKRNIDLAKSPEAYSAQRTIHPSIFNNREQLLAILNAYRKIGTISGVSQKRAKLLVRELLTNTTRTKIINSKEKIDQALESAIKSYHSLHKIDEYVVIAFIDDLERNNILKKDQSSELKAKLNSCDLLADALHNQLLDIKRQAYIRLRVMLFKQAMMMDEGVSAQEEAWFVSMMEKDGVCPADAKKLFDECICGDIDYHQILRTLSSLFGDSHCDIIMGEVRTLLECDGLTEKEDRYLRNLMSSVSASQACKLDD